mmetsp:Transcript_19133/g.26329  ORF Transcript_19133/g.26329 Transcript_19133/m.26329 type:complete len:287 (+) Transcript_19133:90-950(+)
MLHSLTLNTKKIRGSVIFSDVLFCHLDISKGNQSKHKIAKSFSSFSGSIPTPNPHLMSILENNRKWVAETKLKDPEFFVNLGKTQKPKYLYFGCSDSRVPANQILGLGPGEVFVHRNIGNLVPGNDLNALSVLEYAVTHLGVTDIIVTGHYDCGAVRAATSRQDLGLLEHWLRLIRDVYRTHKDYLDLISNDEQRHCSLVELNVIEQCLNLYKTGVVQRKRIQSREALELKQKNAAPGDAPINIEDEIYPRIYGMVFNPAEGQLKKLTVNFAQRVGSLDHIYGLYH